MKQKRNQRKQFTEYLTINKASIFLGVSPSTLRNWDRSGKLKAFRHPVNGYRLYLRDDLERLLINIEKMEKDDL